MTTMGMLCLDTEGCNFQNRDKARFCAQCGIPLQGTLLQDRYEILSFTGKDRTTITFNAHDRHEDRPVTIRALRPTQASAAEQESFLQDADMAVLLSHRIQEPGSIHVTDYGQDGPIAFLVKSEFSAQSLLSDLSPFKQRMAAHVGSDRFSTAAPSAAASVLNNLVDEEDMATQLRPAIPKGSSESTRQPRITGQNHQLPAHNWLDEGNRLYEAERYPDALVAYEAATVQNIVSF